MFWVFLSLALLTFDYRTTYLLSVRAALATVVSPIQYIVNWPTDVINWMITSISTHKRLLNENAELQVQQVLLNAHLQKLLSLEQENKELKGLLQSAAQTNSKKLVVAQVLAVDSDPYMHQIILDQGSNQQIYVGQPVLDTSGIMGQVIYVAPLTSRAMLLSDTRSAIPVEDSRSNVRGTVLGAGALANLKLINMPDTSDIKIGDKLVSSGLGLRYPVGYPVGMVTKVTRSPGAPFLEIEVTPSAYLDRSRLVVLAWPDHEELVKEVEQQLQTMRDEEKKLRANH